MDMEKSLLSLLQKEDCIINDIETTKNILQDSKNYSVSESFVDNQEIRLAELKNNLFIVKMEIRQYFQCI